jgi:hypothetical protein
MSYNYSASMLAWITFIRPRHYLSASTVVLFLVILRRWGRRRYR